ncbi:MAG: TIGR00153 family protein [Desulfobacterales bacterium]|nr:TIGR00153 family protein [Desulfobacterales bacterium]
MRIPVLSMFMASPLDGLKEHIEKVQEGSFVFQQAFECFISKNCTSFEEFRKEVRTIEQEADSIKRRIRSGLPKGTMLPVDKFQLFRYLREQDKIIDSFENSLDWISYRSEQGIPDEIEKDLILLVDAVIDPVEELGQMIIEAQKYFKYFSSKHRNRVKKIITIVRDQEYLADRQEDALKRKIFHMSQDPVGIFHHIKLVELIGGIADHTENACDMMRAMIAR